VRVPGTQANTSLLANDSGGSIRRAVTHGGGGVGGANYCNHVAQLCGLAQAALTHSTQHTRGSTHRLPLGVPSTQLYEYMDAALSLDAPTQPWTPVSMRMATEMRSMPLADPSVVWRSKGRTEARDAQRHTVSAPGHNQGSATRGMEQRRTDKLARGSA
jgi:hypothetical protein